MEWEVVTGIATAATAIVTALVFVRGSFERPRPRWRLNRGAQAFPDGEDGWWLYVTAENIGDGAAYDVRFTSTRLMARVQSHTRAAVVPTGESMTIAVRIRMSQAPADDAYGDALSASVTNSDIGPVSVRVTWNHPPYRWRNRHRTRRVARIAD